MNTLTQEEHEKYDSSIKVLRDSIVVYQAAVQEDIEKGETEGRAKGLAEGRAEGIGIGEKRRSIEIAHTLKQMGLSASDIAKANWIVTRRDNEFVVCLILK